MCLYLLSIQHGICPLLSNDLFRICLKYNGFTRNWRREMPIVVNFIVSNIGDIIWNLSYLRALWQLKAGSLSIRIAWWMHGLSFRKELLGFIGFGVSTYLIVESKLALLIIESDGDDVISLITTKIQNRRWVGLVIEQIL